MKRKSLIGIAAVAALFVALVPALGVAQETSPALRLFVRSRNAVLRSEPNWSAQLLDAPAYGAELRQLNARGQWFEVEDRGTGNRGWIHGDDAGRLNPVLDPGYGRLRWGQSLEQVAEATGAKPEDGRLVEARVQGPISAVAYNFLDGRLWYVEERYRLPSGRGLEDVLQRAAERFGRPHQEGSRRWNRAGPEAGDTELLMEARFYRWDTGVTGFALLSYGPLYEEGTVEVRAEYWSEAIARQAGLGSQNDGLADLGFGGAP
jgi:hypothetical protein